MIDRIITFSMQNKLIIGLFTIALVVWGLFSLSQLPIDAVPDITNNQVQIISIAPTLATQEVEKFITTPIEVSVATIPDVIELRSISRLGLSVVTVVFKDYVDIFKARQLIGERLKEAEEEIPAGVTKPEMAPISTGLGEIFQYVLRVKKGYEKQYNIMELRTIQDWIIKRQLLGTEGVAEVNSYGGYVKQYEVAINPDKLKGMNISILEIFDALEKNNQNTGGAYIEKGSNSYFIRGIGLITTIEDIEKIVVKTNEGGNPVLIRDIATVQFGNANRYGAFVCDTSEAVGGVVMMLKGSNAKEVIENVKDRFVQIEKNLPKGVYIEPYLDRSDLVGRAIGTVSRNLLEGGLIVIFVLVLLLGNLRAGLVVASVIPLSMLFAVSMMNLFGISGNLMSLGAIDFGLIVDGAVIIVENVVHRINMAGPQLIGTDRLSKIQMNEAVLSSSRRMMSSATFGQIIILIVYIPILALVGIEGKMFRPMAQTVTFAILGALILSLTYVPVVSALFLNKKPSIKKNISDIIMSGIHKVFDPLILVALKRKLIVVIISLVLFVISLGMFLRMGGEFIPNLEEGDLAAGVMTLQGGSLTNTVDAVKKANKILLDNFPEVIHAVCKVGAAEIPTDPTPVETGDYIIQMKDKSEWTSADTREELMEKMTEKLSVIPGVVFEMQQPIQMRFNELMTGSKQDVAVKIFGENLDSLAFHANNIAQLIANVEGIEEVQVEKVTGAPQIHINYNRDKIATYGLNISDVNKVLEMGFAGNTAGSVYEEEKRFDLIVRLEKQFRQDIENVKHLYIPLPNGGQVPLEELADIQIKNGTAQVSRENTERRITISFNVRNRDVQSVVQEVQKLIDNKKPKLPAGYYTTIGGQFENLIAAKKRLSIAVPVALLLIFILLFFSFRSIKQTILIYSAVPFAAIGGVFALYLRNMNFSISAGVGFIALFGVAVLNGIVLIAEFNRLEKEKGIVDIYERVLKGLKVRLRPVIMTAAVASLGFLPMALSSSAGAEVQKPLATVVIGGLISSTLLTLVVLPVLYILFTRKRRINLKTKTSLPLLLLLICLGFSANVSSQNAGSKTYSLSQAIDQALNNNTYIKIAGYETESIKKLKKTAWNFGSFNVDYSYGQSNSYKKDNNLNISQGFSFPSVYFNQNKLANVSIKSAQIELSAKQHEIVQEVKSVYYQLSYYYAKLKLLQQEDIIYSDFQRVAKLRFEKGETNLLEKLAAETMVNEIRNLIDQINADIEIYKSKLQNIINETQPIVIADTVLSKLKFPLNNDTTIVTQSIPVKLAMQQIDISHLQRKVEQSKFFPDFSLAYFNQTNKDLSERDRFTGVQVGISFPLLFFSQKGKVQSFKINETIAQLNYEQVKKNVKSKYLESYQLLYKNLNSLNYYENFSLKQADLIIIQAELGRKSGDIGYIEYVQLMKQAIDIKNAYLETMNNYNQSVIAIEGILEKYK